MEPNIINNVETVIETNTTVNKTPKNKMFYVVIGIVAVNIIFIIWTVTTMSAIEKKVNESLATASSQIVNLEQKLNTTESNLTSTQNVVGSLYISNKISEGIVTDQIVIQRATFDDGFAVFDIRPQPTFAYHFLGQGRFDLQDRELKAAILPIIQKAKEYYNDQLSNTKMPSFDSYKIYITQNNYDVAIYENGTLTLSGE